MSPVPVLLLAGAGYCTVYWQVISHGGMRVTVVFIICTGILIPIFIITIIIIYVVAVRLHVFESYYYHGYWYYYYSYYHSSVNSEAYVPLKRVLS